MNATDTRPNWNARLTEVRPQHPLHRAATHFGPVLALYGALKLVGFTVFLYLLHSAGDFREKHPPLRRR